MCTALHFRNFFGRNLDLDRSYGEQVVITPRNVPLVFRKMGRIDSHPAIIGMAAVAGDMPLYFDAVNEHGLGFAGLNFPGNAFYPPEAAGKDNVAPFELPLWLLGQCENLAQVRALLDRINLVNINFAPELPLSPLHFIVADKDASIIVESVRDGLKVYDNPAGVLTNNPTFDMHMLNLSNYMHLSAYPPENRFAPDVDLKTYCLGMGAIGLPGDLSSMSRFVRAAFARENSVCGADVDFVVSQFFHILGYVEMPRGLSRTAEGESEMTNYSACVDQERGVYYYTTYDNRRLNAVDMHRVDLDADRLFVYPLKMEQDVAYQN